MTNFIKDSSVSSDSIVACELSKQQLKSPDTIIIARELSKQQIDIIRRNESGDLGGAIIADRLEKLRNAVWGSDRTKKPASEQQQKQVFEEVIKGLNKVQKEQLISSYAKMGHFYDVAALSARYNYMDRVKEKGGFGGIESLIDCVAGKEKRETIEQLVEKLNKPVFEVVMTAHPTNVNSLESMKAQREVDEAIIRITQNNNSEDNGLNIANQLFKEDDIKLLNQSNLKEALSKYLRTPLLHQLEDKEGKKQDANLTVRDETKIALYFLDNLYEDLPKAYKNYDDALSKYAKNINSNYNPATLNLKTKFGSWASSGDKDGNANVNAETTLEAIALHTQAILKHYSEDLGNINSPELVKWKTSFDNSLRMLDPLVGEIEQLRKDSQQEVKDANASSVKLDQRFDDLSKKLADIRSGLNGKEFEEDLQSVAGSDKEVLNLLRRFRTFGFNFAKIEYRETAKEYDRVVGELIGAVGEKEVDGKKEPIHFSELTPEQKVKKLTELLLQPDNVVAAIFEKKINKIVREGAGKSYTDKSSHPIAYHTLKRMALARDFGDMIKDNVLAECGQIEFKENRTRKAGEKKRIPTEEETIAQGVANILEAQFLQRAVEKNGKRPTVGIVPLFEEPDTMAHIDAIMGAAYENPAYKQQLEVMRKASGEGNPTVQQVMIAHSDNARRSGLQAARAYIHEAHHKIRALNEKRKIDGKEEIKTQFFEGGSISDAYRNGVRAISASIDNFGLHDFAKFTFQGGDLLNYFNHPDSTVRLIDRQISHQAKVMAEINEKDPKAKFVNNLTNGTEVSINAFNESFYVSNNVLNDVVIKALKKTLTDYQVNDFTEKTMGVLLTALDYKKTGKDSNVSSRTGTRGAEEAVEKAVKKVMEFVVVAIDKVRTIGFSKTWQGSGIVPSWIGSKTLKDNLTKFVAEKYEEIYDKKGEISREERDFLDHLLVKDNQLDAGQIRYIYEKSPTFRDAQDRSAFALALTDMNAATAIAGKKLAVNDNDSPEVARNKEYGRQYLERVQATYVSSAKLAYAARTGKELAVNTKRLGTAGEQSQANIRVNDQIRDEMVNSLKHLKEDITNKVNYRAFLLHLQVNHPEMLEDAHMGRVAQSAKDTVEHGRWLAASDPAIARHRARNQSVYRYV